MFYYILLLGVSNGASSEVMFPEGEDCAVTETTISTRCPITGKEMVHPVKNVHCGHHYERDGVLSIIKAKKRKARFVQNNRGST